MKHSQSQRVNNNRYNTNYALQQNEVSDLLTKKYQIENVTDFMYLKQEPNPVQVYKNVLGIYDQHNFYDWTKPNHFIITNNEHWVAASLQIDEQGQKHLIMVDSFPLEHAHGHHMPKQTMIDLFLKEENEPLINEILERKDIDAAQKERMLRFIDDQNFEDFEKECDTVDKSAQAGMFYCFQKALEEYLKEKNIYNGTITPHYLSSNNQIDQACGYLTARNIKNINNICTTRPDLLLHPNELAETFQKENYLRLDGSTVYYYNNNTEDETQQHKTIECRSPESALGLTRQIISLEAGFDMDNSQIKPNLSLEQEFKKIIGDNSSMKKNPTEEKIAKMLEEIDCLSNSENQFHNALGVFLQNKLRDITGDTKLTTQIIVFIAKLIVPLCLRDSTLKNKCPTMHATLERICNEHSKKRQLHTETYCQEKKFQRKGGLKL